MFKFLLHRTYKLICQQSQKVIHYSFIILLKYHFIATSVCKSFTVKFVTILTLSPLKKKKL